IFRARGELSVPPLLHHEIRSAARTFLVENLIRLRGAQRSLFGRDQLPRRLAFRVAGAGEELAEAPALDDHRPSAVLARLDLLLTAFRLGVLLFDLARAGAVGIRAGGDEGREPADLDHHRRS